MDLWRLSVTVSVILYMQVAMSCSESETDASIEVTMKVLPHAPDSRWGGRRGIEIVLHNHGDAEVRVPMQALENGWQVADLSGRPIAWRKTTMAVEIPGALVIPPGGSASHFVRLDESLPTDGEYIMILVIAVPSSKEAIELQSQFKYEVSLDK